MNTGGLSGKYLDFCQIPVGLVYDKNQVARHTITQLFDHGQTTLNCHTKCNMHLLDNTPVWQTGDSL